MISDNGRCYGLNCVPPRDVEVLTPVPVNVILFANRLFADDQVNEVRVGPHPTRLVLSQKGAIWAQVMNRGMTCEETHGEDSCL